MVAQIKTWGYSQAIRIPKEILKEAHLSANDEIDIRTENGIIMISRVFRHKSLEERANEFDGKLNLDGEYDWGEPVGREVW